jgi:pyridoxal phosphate enzyme (YggS family)
MPLQAATTPDSLDAIRRRIRASCLAGVDPDRALLAASKTRSREEIRDLAGAGVRRFGENYVQEGVAKRQALNDLDLEWHLIGPLQSNKCRLAGQHFDWVQSVDRPKLVPLLAQAREPSQAPLNLLLQVNIDDEASKSGCAPDAIGALAESVARHASLRLRGLMAIPSPWPELGRRREAFRRMRALFDQLARHHPDIDTLSMGMSEDFELALAEGATLVRIGSLLFGARPERRTSLNETAHGPQ